MKKPKITSFSASALTGYMVFSAIPAIILDFSKFIIPDQLEEIFQIVPGLLWPFPALLCLQKWIDIGSSMSWIIAILIGGIAVYFPAKYMEKKIKSLSTPGKKSFILGFLFWPFTLLSIDVVLYLIATSLGAPVGV